jgi:hypothetical protein
VCEVVAERADARPGEIGEHRKIGREEQEREDRPGEASVGVEQECGCKRGESFKPQSDPYPIDGKPGSGGCARQRWLKLRSGFRHRSHLRCRTIAGHK